MLRDVALIHQITDNIPVKFHSHNWELNTAEKHTHTADTVLEAQPRLYFAYGATVLWEPFIVLWFEDFFIKVDL